MCVKIMVQYCSYDEQRNVNTSRDAFKNLLNFYIYKKTKKKVKQKIREECARSSSVYQIRKIIFYYPQVILVS